MMKSEKNTLVFVMLLTFFFTNSSLAQPVTVDSITLDYKKIYSLCLDGDIQSALKLLPADSVKKMTEKDTKFKSDFENRFKYTEDRSNFLTERKSSIDELLKIYRDYWRQALLDNSINYDSTLTSGLIRFFTLKFGRKPEQASALNEDSLDTYLTQYIKSSNLHTVGYGKVGNYQDLLVWRTQKDTTYHFSIHGEKISTPVVFMDDFITLGWEQYATLGKYYPGGWAKPEAIYCVRKAYDLQSENFLINYLAHEGRHFSDYKLFPKLSSPDLEYRAKLTQLSMASKTLYDIIEFFINGANYESDNSHSVANYCVIRDLSKAIFGTDFEKDMTKWRGKSIEEINKAGYNLLQLNTKRLNKKGKSVEKYIKQ